MTTKKKIISIILVTLLVLIGGTGVYAFSIFSSMSNDLNTDNLGINTNIKESGIVNVALFGIDGREEIDDPDEVEGNRADTIMIASINFDTGEIKVLSIMRDLMVLIPETETTDAYYDKINAAYNFGGVEGQIRCLNENFDLNIADYVVVNFECMVDAVNALGGVEVNIQNEDVLEWTNLYIDAVAKVLYAPSEMLDNTGVQTLDGVQALAYCRNRFSDDDYGRTARQREVVQQIANKAMNADMLTSLNLLRKLYPYVETSFSISEMTNYAKAFLSMENKTFVASRLPFDTINTAGNIGEISYVIPTTLSDNARVLHYFIFGDETYSPSYLVRQTSQHVADISGYYSTMDWTTTTAADVIAITNGTDDQQVIQTDGGTPREPSTNNTVSENTDTDNLEDSIAQSE